MGVNPNHHEINAATSLADPGSVFHHYRHLISLRHTEPVVAHGTFTMVLPDHPTVYAFTRRLGNSELLVLGNFSADPVALDHTELAEWRAADVLVTNVPKPTPVALQPWEGTAYRRI
jgi:oligo-1,6-glucosidase